MARMRAASSGGLQPAPVTTVNEPVTFDGPQSMSQNFDPADLLPAGARERLEKLRVRASEAHALTVPFSDLQDLNAERIKAEQRLERLVGHPSTGGFGLKPDDDARVTAQTKLVKKLTGDVERLNQRSEARAAAWRTASGALQNIEQWLRHGKPHGTVLQDFEGEPPKLNKNETIVDAISRLQRRNRELKADLARIAAAPMPSSHCKRRLREQIERLALTGTPDVTMLVEHDRDVSWPMMSVRSQVFNAQPGATAFAEIPDTLAILAFLLKPTLLAALDAQIDAESDDKAALSSEDRQQREAEVMGDLLAVERDESHFVWLAQSQNLPCEHRADVSPAAILSVQVVTVPRAATLPGSSVEHAMLSITEGR
jgi:hypothetical protein